MSRPDFSRAASLRVVSRGSSARGLAALARLARRWPTPRGVRRRERPTQQRVERKDKQTKTQTKKTTKISNKNSSAWRETVTNRRGSLCPIRATRAPIARSFSEGWVTPAPFMNNRQSYRISKGPGPGRRRSCRRNGGTRTSVFSDGGFSQPAEPQCQNKVNRRNLKASRFSSQGVEMLIANLPDTGSRDFVRVSKREDLQISRMQIVGRREMDCGKPMRQSRDNYTTMLNDMFVYMTLPRYFSVGMPPPRGKSIIVI